MMGSETFIIVALEVEREEDAVFLRAVHLLGEEGAEGFLAHEGGVENFAGFQSSLFFEDDDLGLGGLALLRQGFGGRLRRDKLDAHGGCGRHRHGFLVREKIVMAHRGDARL